MRSRGSLLASKQFSLRYISVALDSTQTAELRDRMLKARQRQQNKVSDAIKETEKAKKERRRKERETRKKALEVRNAIDTHTSKFHQLTAS